MTNSDQVNHENDSTVVDRKTEQGFNSMDTKERRLVLPRPWSYELSDRLSDDSDCLAISDANGSSVAEMICPRDNEEATARFLVTAVNAHDALVAALVAIRDNPESDVSEYADFCLKTATAALALADKK